MTSFLEVPDINPSACIQAKQKEFNALSLVAKVSLKQNSRYQMGDGSGCFRKPRTPERSGCTPAEPYPLSRKVILTKDQKSEK
jgi:hypothetical protein